MGPFGEVQIHAPVLLDGLSDICSKCQTGPIGSMPFDRGWNGLAQGRR